MNCPHCQQDSKFMGYRDCRIETLLGPAMYERAYYCCSHSHGGWFPTDAELGIEAHKTSGARQVITLVGTLGPFAEAAEVHRQWLADRFRDDRIGMQDGDRPANEAGRYGVGRTPAPFKVKVAAEFDIQDEWQRFANASDKTVFLTPVYP